MLALPIGLAIAVFGGSNAGSAEFAAEASVFPTYQYLDDQAGTTFTLSVYNTGTTTSIGAVEIRRPAHTSNNWSVLDCPQAPAGWTIQTTSLMCRYRSAETTADDIPPGATNSDFRMTASTLPGTANRVGDFEVIVSKRDQFDNPSTITAISAVAAPPGLTQTVHSFEITDAVVANAPVAAGSACPPADKDALRGETVTMVICGRNRTTIPLTPSAAYSSLGGTFIASPGSFSSGSVAPTGSTGAPVVLGNWQSATVTNVGGTNHTVIARIGASANQNSPLTTLNGYTAINRPPTANDDTASTNEDTAAVINVLANDTDPENDSLTVSAVDTTGTVGSVTNNGTNVSYDPNGQFDHLAVGESANDSFTYTVSDGNGGSDTASVSVTVTGVNDAPSAVDDTAAANEDGPAVTVDVLANDSDPDTSDSLSVSAVDTTGTVGSVTNNGTNVSYDPNGQFESLAAGESANDVFTYTVSDGHGGSDTATVTVTVTGANDAPSAVDDTAAANENGPAVTVDVLANDSDADASDSLTVSAVDTTGTAGSVTNNGTNVSYDPNGQFESLAAGETANDVFTYTVSDGNGGSDTATVTVTVTGANDGPTAVDDASAASEDGPAVTVDVLANDSDPDASDSLTVSAVDTTGTVGSVTNNGSNVSYDPNGQFEYLTAGESANDVFTYTVSDGHGGTDTATVTIVVNGANDAPDAVNDTATASEDGPAVTVDVLANDSDPDASDTLTVTAVDTTGTAGSVTNNGTNVSYDPNGQFESLAVGESALDSFTYTVSDGNGGTDTATVFVTVTGVNDAPTAVDDTATVNEGSSATVIDVLANDSDPDASDTLTVSAVDTTGTTGSVTNNGSNVSYDPNGQFGNLGAGETANDVFSYTVSDGNGGTDTATVTVTINGTNTAPVANDDSFTGAIGNTKFAVGVTVTGEPVVNVSGNLLGNDNDGDGDTLTASLVSASAGAAVTVNANGSFTYVSAPGFEGVDTFTYQVTDPSNQSDTATVSITVNDVVWYVNNSAGAGGNGTSTSPYNSLAPLQGADSDESGDYIFVYQGSGSYGGGIVLEASQKLWGQPFGLVVSGNTLVAAGGSNPVISNSGGAGITLASSADVQRVDVSTTAGAGIAATGVGSATVGSNTSVSGATGAAIDVDGGSGTLSIGSNVTNTVGRSVDVSNRTGGTVTLSGSVNDTGTGVVVSSNSGATVTLSGTLTLNTGANPAFAVGGGGTVNVTGSGSTVSTTTAIAVSIQNTTIGASDVRFQSVSSTGASPGILLSTTGSSGGLEVTGTGSAGSGGTIANAGGDGVRLNDTSLTSLSWMNVNSSAGTTAGATCNLTSAADCSAAVDMVNATNVTLDHLSVNGSGQQGISGHLVNGLRVTNSTIDNAGNSNDEFGMLFSRLTGTVLIEDSLVDHSEEGGIRVFDNAAGTLNMTLRRVTIQNNDTVTGEDGFQVETDSSSVANVLVDDSVFDELDRDGVDVLAKGTSTVNVTVKDSDITDGEASGIIAIATNTATLRTAITNNTITNLTSTAINVVGAVNSTVHATVTGNTITHPAPPSAQNGFGIRLSQEEDGDFTAKVENNTTAGTGFGGIKVLSRLGNLNSSAGTSSSDTGTMHATVRNNTVGPSTNSDFALEVAVINAENAMCSVITGNTATGTSLAGMRARQASTSTFQVEGLAAGAQTAATMATYLNTNNVSVPPATATAATSFTGVATGTCRTAASVPLP